MKKRQMKKLIKKRNTDSQVQATTKKFYLVKGIRHNCIVSALTPEEAIKKAEEGKDLVEGEVVSGWEMPTAEEYSSKKG